MYVTVGSVKLFAPLALRAQLRTAADLDHSEKSDAELVSDWAGRIASRAAMLALNVAVAEQMAIYSADPAPVVELRPATDEEKASE